MHRAAFLCLLAGGCAIAFAPILVRLADTGPVASAFWRTALAAPLLWGWLAIASVIPAKAGTQTKPNGSRGWLPAYAAMTIAGLFFALDLGFWHWSIIWTSVANSTLLANLAPIFVTLAGWLIWKQKVTGTFLVAMAVAIAGMFVLVGPNFQAGGTQLLGDATAALTAVFYAGYMLAIKFARDANASTGRLMAWSTTITALALLPVALLSPQPMLPAGASGWLVLLGLALVTQILGQGLIAYAFAHLPASLSSVSLLIQPVVATLAAWAIFGETVSAAQVLGGAIVLAGIWLARRGS
ncbi:MAG: DMT family transporter [Pseudomonadota bacterium]|nr:DMT family transporter [Pseudomonadota bacterium]